jgi:predicted methyltransferase
VPLSQSEHPSLGPCDPPRLAIARKVLIVIDHAAASGSGLRDTETLHRIDPNRARREIEAAGFVFESRIDDLGNRDDDHTRSVFDPAVRGRTDQFVYKIKKPGMPE